MQPKTYDARTVVRTSYDETNLVSISVCQLNKKIHLLSILPIDNLIVTGEQITDTVYCQKHYMDKMPKSPKVY